ncbi:A/G-specific adenine glycosylase [Arcanobacterium pinnipediorum]|uniref:Adenine DNA glycosylase n=1 Tax=Arcanobacterium pinnipediorum TaxID=1503041 RepID=A0ABY5AIQ4_9ACTO|nr:A/G-specific adenine glycosylase [Arcanobacterium pinnipediorum]USR79631.1 A/G-specific adenine glycosylase [Arcanobacterium pinnipediorum]
MTDHPTSLLYRQLTKWFARSARPLPWRNTSDPWAILLCEVMSQQTPVSRVEPTWYAWLERWPTPRDLAQASPAEVLLAWDRMGYPRRALRLRECALEITHRFDGKIPRERDELLSLPGIGPYTADAILAFAFEEYSVVLDTNIRRVLARWNGQALAPPHQTSAERQLAQSYVPPQAERAWRWNAAIMEFGALVCTARNPRCPECPVAATCGWKNAGYPGDEYANTRTTQKWAGTNRQARGKIMDVLRSHPDQSFTEEILRDLSALSEPRFSPALRGLLTDGLIAQTPANSYCLPPV